MSDKIISEIDLKKQYLKRYKKNRALIDRLNDKIFFLDQRLVGIKSPGFSDMPRGGTPITKEDLIEEKLEIEERIRRLEEKGKKIKAEILDKIDELEDTRYVDILEDFFIKCKDFDIISEESGYTVRHVIRLYSEAIKSISV